MPADHCRAPQECDLRFVLSMEPGDVNQHDLVYFPVHDGVDLPIIHAFPFTSGQKASHFLAARILLSKHSLPGNF